MDPRDIEVTTSIRTLKQIRKRLKKARADAWALQLVENRIKQLQLEHVHSANFKANERALKLMKKETSK